MKMIRQGVREGNAERIGERKEWETSEKRGKPRKGQNVKGTFKGVEKE